MKSEIQYKNYIITYDIKPVPDRDFDWNFEHDDYDGGSRDPRCGYGSSIEDVKKQIDELENE